jgi:protocatechuate 3,4-dioxygenase beta subunit
MKYPDADHGGLARDLQQMSRRDLFGWVAKAAAGLTLIPILESCGDQLSGDGVDAGSGSTCSQIPEETAGPFPGDGTNGANALVLSGIVRSDIRASIGSATGVADGIPLTVTLTFVDATTCTPLVGHAVYLWHCDRDGNYSMYSAAIANENYLRGVQVTDAAGQVTFTTIFPACYSGRWPHLHLEVYPTLASATNGSSKLATSQLALPKATCDDVFATAGYSQSVSNLAHINITSDDVFADGVTLQLPTMTGSVVVGYTATLTVAV